MTRQYIHTNQTLCKRNVYLCLFKTSNVIFAHYMKVCAYIWGKVAYWQFYDYKLSPQAPERTWLVSNQYRIVIIKCCYVLKLRILTTTTKCRSIENYKYYLLPTLLLGGWSCWLQQFIVLIWIKTKYTESEI